MADVPLTLIEHDELFPKDEDRFYEDGVMFRRELAPGSGVWMRGTEGEIAALWFTCPCGCGAVTAITVNRKFGKAWDWDGNVEKPTCSPSILRTTGCRWHGYLHNGIFQSV